MFEKALDVNRRVYGEGNPKTSTNYSDLGRLARDNGELEKAREFFDKSLAIVVKVYGENNLNVATKYSDIGRLARDR